MLSLLAGLGLGLSLIIAIGAQNVFVLRQGIRREHIGTVIAICAASDALLILAGTAGLGALLEALPWLIVAARIGGAVFLTCYGIMAAVRAWRGGASLRPASDAADEMPAVAVNDRGIGGAVRTDAPTRALPVITAVLALTWLNPHVYLDTVLMLGSIAATHGDRRWLFAAGAVIASVLWFTVLGFGARHLGRWLRTSRSWRILDGVIAVIMIALAIGLLAPLTVG